MDKFVLLSGWFCVKINLTEIDILPTVHFFSYLTLNKPDY